MQAESSYICCRLQHGCRFVQLQVRGCKLLYVTRGRTLERGSYVSARAAPGWVSSGGSNGDGAQGAGAQGAPRAKHTYYLLPLCLSSTCPEAKEYLVCLPCLSTRMPRSPRASPPQHSTAAAPVAWIPWR